MNATIECQLDQVGYTSPAKKTEERGQLFNRETFTAPDVPAALAILKDRYGVTAPRRPRGVFIDTPEGAEQVGFVAARWNRDCSHGGKSWYEENWVSFATVTRAAVALPPALRANP